MSFWNNPENNSIKTVLVLAILVLAGWFVYTNMQTNGRNQGRVISTGAKLGTPSPARLDCAHANTHQTISGDCVWIAGDCTVSDVHTGPCTGTEKPPASVRITTGTGVSGAQIQTQGSGTSTQAPGSKN
jgi:hypothetical protein